MHLWDSPRTIPLVQWVSTATTPLNYSATALWLIFSVTSMLMETEKPGNTWMDGRTAKMVQDPTVARSLMPTGPIAVQMPSTVSLQMPQLLPHSQQKPSVAALALVVVMVAVTVALAAALVAVWLAFALTVLTLSKVADASTFDDATYYANAIAEVNAGSGASIIKSALNTIITQDHKNLTYSEVWTALTESDEDPGKF